MQTEGSQERKQHEDAFELRLMLLWPRFDPVRLPVQRVEFDMLPADFLCETAGECRLAAARSANDCNPFHISIKGEQSAVNRLPFPADC